MTTTAINMMINFFTGQKYFQLQRYNLLFNRMNSSKSFTSRQIFFCQYLLYFREQSVNITCSERHQDLHIFFPEQCDQFPIFTKQISPSNPYLIENDLRGKPLRWVPPGHDKYHQQYPHRPKERNYLRTPAQSHGYVNRDGAEIQPLFSYHHKAL